MNYNFFFQFYKDIDNYTFSPNLRVLRKPMKDINLLLLVIVFFFCKDVLVNSYLLPNMNILNMY